MEQRMNGVYKIAGGGWVILKGRKAIKAPNRDKIRLIAKQHKIPANPKGTLNMAEIKSEIDLRCTKPTREYIHRDWEDLEIGDMVETTRDDKDDCKRLYQSAFMHRENHPDSTFDFETVKDGEVFAIRRI